MKTYTVRPNEYSARTYTMALDKALGYMPYAQAGVVLFGDDATLYSYSTAAASIQGNMLYVTCLCSNTTRRHVSAFLKEYAPRLTYQDAKRAYLAGRPIDIETGEFVQDVAA